MASEQCPIYAPFFGALGVVAAIVFANFGAAYGMAKSGIGIMSAGVLRPENLIRSLTPTIMAGILSIYGLVVSIQIIQYIYSPRGIPLGISFLQLGAGLAAGLSALAAGFAIGIVGDAGVRAFAQQPRMFIGMIMVLIFSEVLGLYGMIIALLLLGQTGQTEGMCG